MNVTILPILNDNYTFILECENEIAVVDPGSAAPIDSYLQQNNLSLTAILCTHHHPDHIAGNLQLKEKTNCKIYGAFKDRDRIPGIDHTLSEGDEFLLGDAAVQVIDTPGHTAHHISYYFANQKKLFCGDTVFSAGCGRLFEGTAAQMLQSFHKIASLPEDVQIYCGHEYTTSNVRFALTVDPNNDDLKSFKEQVAKKRSENRPTIPSTIAVEKKVNPFMRCSSIEIRKTLQMLEAKDEDVFAKIRSLKDNF